MDPNASLEAMRDALGAMTQAQQDNDSLSYDEAAYTVAEHAQALDDWLTRGGFLPEAWQG